MTESDLLSREEAADLIGVLPGSLTHDASMSKRKVEEGGQLDRYDCPLPRKHVRERIVRAPGAKGPHSRLVPYWDRGELMAWRQALFSRPAPERDRDEQGRYLKTAS